MSGETGSGGAAARLDAGLEDARRELAAGRPAEAESLLLALLERHPEAAAAWDALGRARNNLRRLPEAEAAFREALRLDDRLAPAWNHLGHVLRATGRQAAAHDAFGRAVTLDPADPVAARNLAGSLLQRGEHRAAAALLTRAVAAAPKDALAHAQLAHACQAGGDSASAMGHYRRALELEPGLADAAAGLGALHQSDGDFPAAGRRYRQALAVEPGHPMATAGLAAILEIEGRFDAGYALLAPLLEAGAPPPGLAVTGARLLRRLGRPGEGLALLERVAAPDVSDTDAALLDYNRGDLLDDLGDHPRAFGCYRRANERLPSGFDPADFRRTVDRLVAFFSPARLATLPRAEVRSDAPVLIVGMPRSGTSLVEQALAAHSRVHAAGERTALFDAVRTLAAGNPGANWPEILGDVAPATLTGLARRYLAEGGADGGDGADRITDKMPANFLNLGLAALMLPGARVVYCRRDPLDVGLSCFRQNFLSEGMAFARRLEDIALYQQGCLRLMAHWQSVSVLPIHVVDYESLVEDFEAGLRGLLEFLDLPWEPACLRPDLSERVVATASYDQVRRPVYGSSVGRWRDYERELAPLRAALASDWVPGNAR
jgi:tetratricopeptide (TPR) repeat protein